MYIYLYVRVQPPSPNNGWHVAMEMGYKCTYTYMCVFNPPHLIMAGMLLWRWVTNVHILICACSTPLT